MTFRTQYNYDFSNGNGSLGRCRDSHYLERRSWLAKESLGNRSPSSVQVSLYCPIDPLGNEAAIESVIKTFEPKEGMSCSEDLGIDKTIFHCKECSTQIDRRIRRALRQDAFDSFNRTLVNVREMLVLGSAGKVDSKLNIEEPSKRSQVAHLEPWVQSDDDYRTVTWGSHKFEQPFSPQGAAALRLIANAAEPVSAGEIKKAVGGDLRSTADAFRSSGNYRNVSSHHPAWKTMIVRVGSKRGTCYRIANPNKFDFSRLA